MKHGLLLTLWNLWLLTGLESDARDCLRRINCPSGQHFMRAAQEASERYAQTSNPDQYDGACFLYREVVRHHEEHLDIRYNLTPRGAATV